MTNRIKHIQFNGEPQPPEDPGDKKMALKDVNIFDLLQAADKAWADNSHQSRARARQQVLAAVALCAKANERLFHDLGVAMKCIADLTEEVRALKRGGGQ